MNDHVNPVFGGILDAMAPTVEPAAPQPTPQPTPGDWKISKQFAEPWVEIVTVDKFGDESLPFISCRNSDKDANSLLVVAAKETAAERDRLLAALKGLFEHCSMIHARWGEGNNQKEADQAIRQALAAIDKAEGGKG